jgi:hypothetical protein
VHVMTESSHFLHMLSQLGVEGVISHEAAARYTSMRVAFESFFHLGGSLELSLLY